jgi:short subunit dehydrogenase-like uncharacterized protein
MTKTIEQAETSPSWMIYGAYGYTGELVAEEAVRRGHRPLLAGRSAEKLIPLSERLGLDWVAPKLDDARALNEALRKVDLVFHAAGPFAFTSNPMIRACLATGTNYVDITGELPVFRNTFTYDQAAIERGIALISGVGFDVVPTDCLAEYVANQVPEATDLEIAVAALDQASPGTTKTMLEMLPQGVWRRRAGKLVPCGWAKDVKKVRFLHGERVTIPIPWGDLETAYQTTGIPNITTYLAFPPRSIRLLRWTAPLSQRILKLKPIRRVLQRLVDRIVRGPDAKVRQTARSYVWARAADKNGNEAQAWLETVEGYQFTIIGGVRCVERVLQERPVGALTPALAFGADFVLEIEGTRRLDAFPAGR